WKWKIPRATHRAPQEDGWPGQPQSRSQAMTPPGFAVIHAGSEWQALDWNLVLLSRGIDSVVQRDPETGRWCLVVRDGDYPPAVEELRSYAAENRTPRWRHPLPGVGLLFDVRCVACLLFLALLHGVDAQQAGRL